MAVVKGSVLRILSATTMAGFLAVSFEPAVMASAAPILLTVTINGQSEQIALPSNIGPGLHDIALPATISGEPVLLPPVEFVVSDQGTATVVTPKAPALLTVTVPGLVTGAAPVRIEAQYTSASGATTTEAIGLDDFDLATNSVTFRPLGTLTPGNYTLTLRFTYADGSTVTSPPETYESTAVDTPDAIAAVVTGSVSLAANQSATETFTVTDAAGIGVAGVPVDFATTGTLSPAGLSTTSAVTNADGQATVTFVDPHPDETGTITATVSANPSLVGATGTISVGSASTSGTAASVTRLFPSLATGAVLVLNEATPITFVAENAAGSGVAGVVVDFSLTGNLPSAGQLSSPTAVTGAGGSATVLYTPDEMTVDGNSVTGTVYAVVGSDTAIHGQTGTLTVTADAPAHVSAAVASAQVTAGATDALSYTVTDAAGEALANVAVTASVSRGGLGSSDGTSETVMTNADGVATFQFDAPYHVGSATVTVTAGASASAETTLAVVAGPPALVSVGSTTTSEMVGGVYALEVYLTDQYGNPILGNVTETLDVYGSVFQPSPSGVSAQYGSSSPPNLPFSGPTGTPSSTVANPLALTFVNGSATFYFEPADSTLGQASDVVGVALPGSSGQPPLSVASVSGIAVSAADEAPARVVADFSGSTLSAGVATPMTFTVLGNDGNPIPGVTVMFATSSAAGGVDTLQAGQFTDGLLAVTNARGEATDPFVGTKAGDTGVILARAINAEGSAVVSGETGVLTVVPGAPAAIAASFPASSSVDLYAGTSQSVTFTVLDDEGNPIPDTPVTFGVDNLTGYVSRDGQAQSSGVTNATGSLTVTYTPNPDTVAGSGYLWVRAGSISGDGGTMAYTPPSGWAVANMQNVGTESGNAAGTTATVSGHTVTSLSGQPLADVAIVHSGMVALDTPLYLAPDTSGATWAVWSVSSNYYGWDLTAEAGSTGTLGYTDFVLTEPSSSSTTVSGELVSASFNGAPSGTALISGTVQVPFAQFTSGTWSLLPPTVQDYWVVYNNSYYQLDVSVP